MTAHTAHASTSRAAAATSQRDWETRAACRTQPPHLFTDPKDETDINAALKICGRCPVRQACLQTALAHPPDADVGIWGGTTEEARHELRQQKTLNVNVRVRRTATAPHTDPTGIRRDATANSRDPQRQEAARAHAENSQAQRPPTADGDTPPARNSSRRAAASTARPPAALQMRRDAYGDLTDTTGRVIIFRIHGSPPYMLMIDRRPVARTHTVAEARHIAAATLHQPERDRSVPAHLDPARQQPTPTARRGRPPAVRTRR